MIFDFDFDERGQQLALLHRLFRLTEVRRFGGGRSGRTPIADDQVNSNDRRPGLKGDNESEDILKQYINHKCLQKIPFKS